MCGRYTTPDKAAIERFYKQIPGWWQAVPNFNASPTQGLPIVLSPDATDGVPDAYWSLLPQRLDAIADWKYSTFNLRAEKLDDRRAMAARTMQSSRCLVPMTGFYEWPGLTDGNTIRVLIRPAVDAIWLAAGLYSRYQTADGSSGYSFGIITGPANRTMRKLHNRGKNRHRMPMFIAKELAAIWLRGSTDEARALLEPIPDDQMIAYEVARNAGNAPEQTEQLAAVDWNQLA